MLLLRSNDSTAPGLSPYEPPPGLGSVDRTDFVGSDACAGCHADPYDRWSTSTHGRAGGPPDPGRLLAPFDGTPIVFADATVVPLRLEAGSYGFVVEWTEGTDTVLVDGVVGGGHMVGGGTQGFFTLGEDGGQRFVPFDWSATAEAWFCNTRYPNAGEWLRITPELPLTACADWPPRRMLGQVYGVANCDTCHGSQIQTTRAAASGRFETRLTGLSINCESCHGPGREHIERVQAGAALTDADLGLTPLGTLDEDGSLETCFRCHATRLVLHEGDLPGEPLESNVSLLLPLLTDRPFLPDNRTGTFAYQLNHIGSGCYLDGSMTCTSCHDPHGQTYQDEFGGALPDRFDDGQCLSCHQSKAGSPEAHTHHPAESTGGRCVSCHMPYLQHRSIGQDVPYARSDHTIPIPRPGLDERLGVTSACAGCHAERSPLDLAQQTTEWYGQLKPWRPLVDGIARGPSVSDPVQAAALLLRPEDGFSMAQAAGLSQYLLRFIRPDEGPADPAVRNAFESLASDPDPDVRALALAGLHLGWGEDPEVRTLLAERLAAGDVDPGRVRDRWSAALRYMGDAYRFRGAADLAEASYRRALEAVPDHPLTLEGLGVALLAQQRPDEAESSFRASFRADSTRPDAWVNVARALGDQGRTEDELSLLRQAVARFPYDPRAHFALGNTLLRNRDVLQAGEAFRRALELDPGMANARLGLAQVLAARGQEDEARRQVLLALAFEPSNPQARVLAERLEGR